MRLAESNETHCIVVSDAQKCASPIQKLLFRYIAQVATASSICVCVLCYMVIEWDTQSGCIELVSGMNIYHGQYSSRAQNSRSRIKDRMEQTKIFCICRLVMRNGQYCSRHLDLFNTIV